MPGNKEATNSTYDQPFAFLPQFGEKSQTLVAEADVSGFDTIITNACGWHRAC
jgi:hypothetical protein